MDPVFSQNFGILFTMDYFFTVNLINCLKILLILVTKFLLPS